MQVVVQERIVGYDRLGKGKILVLLHGWGSSRVAFKGLATTLSKKFDVVSVDVPGFGESAPPGAAWGLAEYRDWLNEFLKKLKVSSPYAVIGHSNGGAIAIKAVSSGLPVGKLILLGASGVRNREKGKKAFLQTIAKTGKVATRVLPTRARAKIRSKWYKRIGSELYDRPGMEDSFKKVVAEDLLIDAAMISAPTMLVYGSEDRATPPIYGEMYHRVIEGSELHIVEGAGHYSFIDQPDHVVTLIKDFLG